ncbi:hypothetical protein BH11BAC2_BH11BAC2_00960 [soil metagenome]
MLRNQLIKSRKNHSKIKWRSHEVLRIEGFSDAVFAFAMTLLVVSLEVPETFSEMKHGLYGVFGFAICFIMLFMIWYEQYIYFRLFSLNDLRTIVLNALLLFVVLIYVYPLKFLFSLLTMGNSFEHDGVMMQRIQNSDEIRELMVIYSSGFCLVYFVLFLLYLNAYKKRAVIGLNAIESYCTKSEIYKHITMISIGMFSLVLSCILNDGYAGLSGMAYMIIGPALGILFSFRSKQLKKIFTAEEIAAHESWLHEE